MKVTWVKKTRAGVKVLMHKQGQVVQLQVKGE